MNKEYKEVEPLSSIKDFNLKGTDGKEYNLLNQIKSDKKYHILIVIRAMMTCYVSQFKEEVEKFCKTNTDFDLLPYPSIRARFPNIYKKDKIRKELEREEHIKNSNIQTN